MSPPAVAVHNPHGRRAETRPSQTVHGRGVDALGSGENKSVTDDDDLTAFGRRVDGRFRAVDERVDATRNQIDLLRMDLSDKVDAARRDMGRLVLVWVLGSTVLTAGLCLATVIVARLVD